MDLNEDREKERRLYFKQLRKGRKEHRRKQFDELVDSIRSRLAKGEEPEPDPGSLELLNDDLRSGIRQPSEKHVSLVKKQVATTAAQ